MTNDDRLHLIEKQIAEQAQLIVQLSVRLAAAELAMQFALETPSRSQLRAP
ncbi:hypothetical protein SPKIRA_08500 [Sphingomonas paucimobilis]|uniref:hypothetical protein n=1 Tax=Sphingomonas paucimobilis TaxID=13689 RepID=UPI0015DD41B7|nr:hypothetical protein [Sphingomonas paucimobilis]BCI70020.1 hypothetical protein SPKIRA_08500 [Sphingomonas paucimobilis]